ncbi:5-dehydro-2-deoxygluconokinase [Chakrabartyella piscis]|uniref:5-dehydro-2-deoxygluconokinase n=1 Tax=Chakrabartyella piscis TaxID=2918914 RepID=UPI002958B947|nr:5-dehydro-2-deoxygluconokinase [Chakrabartyella piscis]
MSRTEKTIDITTVGRAGIDLNTTILNTTFEHVPAFEKSIGGSPANIIQGTARLGLKSAFIGKISGDGMGEYILNEFAKQGIETSGVCIDRTGARNCLALTEIVSSESSGTYQAENANEFHHGTYLYRERTADMLITPEDINEDVIAKSRAVLLSGTAFSTNPSRDAMFQVMEYAKKHETKIVLDIDYRPTGWKDLEEASTCYQKICSMTDIIIGNREEFDVVEYTTMPDNKDDAKSAKAFLEMGAELVIVKDGAKGSDAYLADGSVLGCAAIPTKIVKTFGSGDAYAAGVMYGMLTDQGILYAMQLGSACASIVLTKINCAPAIPTLEVAEAHRMAHLQEMMK